MNRINAFRAMLVTALASVVIVGCTVDKQPDVITTPGTTTVVHDKTPAPNVTVNTPSPAPSHTDTTTNTSTAVPAGTSGGTPTTNTSTTTTG
jgi:uncharacterized protein YcfL